MQYQGSRDYGRIISFIFKIFLLLGIYSSIFVNYLLFHSLAEVFSIVVAFSVFVITWNSRKYIENQYLIIIGIAYLFIAFLDLIHTLSYHGMNIFTDYDYYANQLWIGARYMESLTLALSFFLMTRKRINVYIVFSVYLLLTVLLIAAIFTWKIFPLCFIEGLGQTMFKKVSEYIICSILALSLFILNRRKGLFDPSIYRLVFWSIISTIVAELFFAFYISNYGVSNVLGHFFKIFSFYLVYKAIIQSGINDPFNFIFRETDLLNQRLNHELELKKKQEEEREKLIGELKEAMSHVNKLSGLLPICMYCKNIRDDQGYWSQVEEYISDHSEADFSHSICPDCEKKHFPNIKLK